MSTPAVYTLPSGFAGRGFNASMQPTQGVGFNASNQLVDANGELVRDASSRPISNPVSNQTAPSQSAPTSSGAKTFGRAVGATVALLAVFTVFKAVRAGWETPEQAAARRGSRHHHHR